MTDEPQVSQRSREIVASIAWNDGCLQKTRDDILTFPALQMVKVKASVACMAVDQALATLAPPPLPEDREKLARELLAAERKAALPARSVAMAYDEDEEAIIRAIIKALTYPREAWPEDAPDISEGLAMATALENEADRAKASHSMLMVEGLQKAAKLIRRLTGTLRVAYAGPLAAYPRAAIGEETAVVGPVWQDKNGDWLAEVQAVGGHSVLATAYGETREEAGEIQSAIIAALSSARSSIPEETADCARCAGSGEIVTDWDRYSEPKDGDKGDEATTACPDCDGTGKRPSIPEDDGKLVEELRGLLTCDGHMRDTYYPQSHFDGATISRAATRIETLSRENERLQELVDSTAFRTSLIGRTLARAEAAEAEVQRVRAETLEVVDKHVQRARDAVAACRRWSPAQGEWSRARDLGLDIADELRSLTGSTAFVGQDD